MAELTDYRDGFDPEFSHEKLAKKTLLELLKAYMGYLQKVDGHWYVNVMNKWGNDEAFDCDVKVWRKAQVHELRVISSILNIQGNDVTTVMKYFQVSPWMWVHEHEIEVKSSSHGILTLYTCPVLSALEKEGSGREKRICQELEPQTLGLIAHYFNPEIKIIPIKVPPRTDYSDICCRWGFEL